MSSLGAGFGITGQSRRGGRTEKAKRDVSRRATPVAQERNPTAPRTPTRQRADTPIRAKNCLRDVLPAA